jgi:competence protein ComEC
MFRNRPAMKFCFPFVLGIIIGWQWSFSFLMTVLVVVVLIFLFSMAAIWRKNQELKYSAILAFSLIFAFGVFKITFDAKYVFDDSIANFTSQENAVRLQGRITDLPRLTAQSVRFVVEAEKLNQRGKTWNVSGGILVSTRRNNNDKFFLDSLSFGREVILTGQLAPAGTARNPGEFDLKHYLHLNNVYARLYLDKNDAIILGEEARNNFQTALVYPVRRSVAERLDRFVGGEEAKFLKGLVIGERSEITTEVKTAFINSGVMHILAVSGLHVVIVTMILLVLLQVLRIPENIRIVITSLLLIYYIFLTGGAASVARAVFMAIIFLGGKLFEQKSDIYNTLAISAIFLLIIDAKQLFQPGFQLSFVAVFSLVYLYPKFYGMKNLLPDYINDNRWINAIAALIAVSLAASIGTLPFTSIYFGKITLIGIVANMIIVPLSNIILALGMLTVAVSYISAWIASLYAEATSFLTWLLLRLVELFGNLPFSYIDSHFTFWSSVAFYAAVAFAINLGRKEIRKILIIAMLIAANIFICVWLFFIPTSRVLRITFLDVGQGDAVFLEFPDSKNLLIDAGPKTFNSDAGARFVGPFLEREGIHHLNTVLLTHPHNDHLGGIPYILRHFKVDEVIDAGSAANSSLYRDYLHLIDSLKITRSILRAGAAITGFDNVRLYVLHPNAHFVPADSSKRINFNNQSLVLKVIYGSTAALLVGDAEKESEDQFVKSYDKLLQSNVLKVGHHGSITGSSIDFLNLVHPAAAIVSVGVKNKFEHPSPVVLKRLTESGCKIYRTDESGAIIIESDGNNWHQIDWH